MRTKMLTAGCVFAIGILSFAVQAAEYTPSRRPTPAQSRLLDLKAPQLTRIFSIEQINAILSRATDPALEHVEVEASRIGDMPMEDNSASDADVVFKSIVRWLAPSQVYAAHVNVTPDATSPLRPAPLLLANYHASFAPPASQR